MTVNELPAFLPAFLSACLPARLPASMAANGLPLRESPDARKSALSPDVVSQLRHNMYWLPLRCAFV